MRPNPHSLRVLVEPWEVRFLVAAFRRIGLVDESKSVLIRDHEPSAHGLMGVVVVVLLGAVVCPSCSLCLESFGMDCLEMSKKKKTWLFASFSRALFIRQ